MSDHDRINVLETELELLTRRVDTVVAALELVIETLDAMQHGTDGRTSGSSSCMVDEQIAKRHS